MQQSWTSFDRQIWKQRKKEKQNKNELTNTWYPVARTDN